MRYRIRNWNKYQHYRDRNPPWIKLHFDLLTSRDWVTMDDASRVIAIACMLIASRSNGEIDGSAAGLAYLHRVAYLNAPPDLRPLVANGFLVEIKGDTTGDSALQADDSMMQADARPETETETETETEEETEKESVKSPSGQPAPQTERDAPQAPPSASPAARFEASMDTPSENAPELPQDAPNGSGKVITPEDARTSCRRKHGASTGDVLEPYPTLSDYYPKLWASITEAHPHVNPPKPGTANDRKARDALAKLVRIDGYPEAEVVEALRWVFDADDKQAEFWRGNVLSPVSLRVAKGGDGVTKFAKLYAQWKRRKPESVVSSHWEGNPDDIF